MARIEPLAPRDTDIGSSRAHNAARDSLCNGFRFPENKRGWDALGKQERRERGGMGRKKSEFDPRV